MSKENDREAKVKNDVSYEHKSYTAWHIFLADVLDYLFDPEDLEVYPFVKLGTLPLESDFIIIRKAGSEEELMSHYPDFVFLIPYLGEITVIEYKSPLDKVEKSDFDTLRIYRLLTKKKYMVDEDYRVRCITLASHFESGYKQHIARNGYRFEELRKGIYGHEGDHQRYYWMDLAIIGQEDPENPINLFSSNFKKYCRAGRPRLRQSEVMAYICQAIFRRKLGMMNNIEIRQLPEFITSIEEMTKRLLESFSVEERLAGLKPEERLAGLKPEEILVRLKPEERLAGLKLEERLTGLSQDQLKKLKELLDK